MTAVEKRKQSVCLCGIWSGIWILSACGGGNGGGAAPDTETETPPDTATKTDSVHTSDTGEPVEQPPELPERCELITEKVAGAETGQIKLSEAGNASLPDIQFSPDLGSVLTTWAYFDTPNDGEQWEIQTASYETASSEVDGTLTVTRHVGDIGNPAVPGPVSEKPAMGVGGDGFGLVWLDGRWDSTCDVATFTDCRREVAFLPVESGQAALDGGDGEPVRVSPDAEAVGRPAAAGWSDGFAAVWVEVQDFNNVLMAARLDLDGNVLAEVPLSGDEEVDDYSGGAVAANESLAVFVWAPQSRDRIIARIWYHDEATPEADELVVSDEGGELLKPKIASGDESFMVLWSARVDVDADVFARPLDAQGEPVLSPQRITWTVRDVLSADIAFGNGAFAAAWASESENGEIECVREECNDQIFMGLLDAEGAPTSVPVRISDDPNENRHVALAFDGVGFTAVWESRRLNRFQIFYGQMICP